MSYTKLWVRQGKKEKKWSKIHYNEINRTDGPKDDEAKNDKKMNPKAFLAAQPTLLLHRELQTYELFYHYYAKGGGGDKVEFTISEIKRPDMFNVFLL